MIDREQVLHIARLARLRLDEEEVERMAQELSGILEHVETIGSLDLDGVEPTTHVVALENVMRADVPVPSLDRERALAGAPDSSSRLLPRPLAAGVSDPRLLTVAEGLGEIAAGNLSADEWFDAYAATPDELGAYLWRPDGEHGAGGGRRR